MITSYPSRRDFLLASMSLVAAKLMCSQDALGAQDSHSITAGQLIERIKANIGV